MTQKEKAEKKEELVNEIIFLSSRLDDIWQYHPENPNKVDVLKETLELKDMISKLDNEIQNLG